MDKEAFEKARSAYGTGAYDDATLEFLFPQLKESEDERIRKELIDMIKECTNWTHKKDYVKYLEKQKENPKNADSISADCVSDAKCEDRWHKVGDSLPDNPREVLCKDEAGNYFIGRYYVGEGWEISNYDDEDKPHHLNPPVSKWINFPLELQKEPENTSASTMIPSCWEVEQKEQKPQLYWHKIKAYEKLPCRAYIYKFAYEQENNFHGKATINGCLIPNEPVTIGCDTWYLPVEDIKNLPKEDELDTTSPTKTVEQKLIWGEEEMKLLDLIINDYEKVSKSFCGYAGKIGLLKAIRNGEYNLSKPAEWSEENEKTIDTIVSVLGQYIDYKAVSGTGSGYATPRYSKEIAWLKSLRPSWRPSEEQMEALREVAYSLVGTGTQTDVYLVQLYEHLKML